MIFCASDGPTPGSACSSSRLAVLMWTIVPPFFDFPLLGVALASAARGVVLLTLTVVPGVAASFDGGCPFPAESDGTLTLSPSCRSWARLMLFKSASGFAPPAAVIASWTRLPDGSGYVSGESTAPTMYTRIGGGVGVGPGGIIVITTGAG